MRFEHTMRQLMVLIHFQSIHIHYISTYLLYIEIGKYIIVKKQEQMKIKNKEIRK